MFQVQSDVFLPAINRARKFTSKKCPLPVLSQIKLEVHGNTIQIMATDLDNSYTECVHGENYGPSTWSTMIQRDIPKYKGLLEIIKTDDYNMQINQFQFAVNNAEDFPYFPQFDGECSITTISDFNDKITKALSCCGKEDRLSLDTVHFRGLCSRVESTDGYRVNVSAVDFIPQSVDCCVPASGLKLALSVIPKNKPQRAVTLHYTDKNLFIQFIDDNRNIIVTIRLRDEPNFPVQRIDELFGSGLPDIPVWVSKTDLEKGLRLAKIMTSEKNPAVTFSFVQDGMQLTSKLEDIGNCKHKIISYTPEYLLGAQVIFNVDLLIPAVKLWDQENVPLYISSPSGLALVGNQGIMPMRP